ncbi:sensor histidine kinase [Natronoglycomyces albus]|nr:sensor domain-containing protein [Natronoglycomyces albus]
MMEKFSDGIQRRSHTLVSSILLCSLSLMGMLLIVAAALASVLVLFWVGIPLTIALIWKIRAWAGAQRRIFTDRLDTPVSNPYRPWPRGSLDRRALWLIRDPATWRDVAWLGINSTLGALMYGLLIGFFAVGAYLIVQPLLYLFFFSDGVRETLGNVGFYQFDSVAKTLMLVPLGVLFGAAWWHWTERLMRWYAGVGAKLLGPTAAMRLSAQVSQLRESRDDTVDTAAAELRRIERDLHDGAQARLVALGLSIGMAEDMVDTDPEGAKALLAEARDESQNALNEIRNLARGIHPPVLADRGFSGALQAMALANPLPVTIIYKVTGKLPGTVESAVYFATSEVFTNITKHAHASKVAVIVAYVAGQFVIEVQDDGIGGASAETGGGLEGVRRRVSAFDGTIDIDSPQGGPTTVTIAIPCQLQDSGADEAEAVEKTNFRRRSRKSKSGRSKRTGGSSKKGPGGGAEEFSRAHDATQS